MKKLTQFSVNYPVTILMVVLGVILLGFISFEKLGVDLFPDLNSPRIYIELTSGETSPEELEENYVENIESTVIRQEDVVQVTSKTKVGSSQITVEYEWNTDMDEAYLNLQRALSSYSQNQNLDDFTITQHDPNTAPVLIIGLAHSELTDLNELRKTAENYVRNELVRLDGVAEVELSGEEEREIVINTDPYQLKAFNVTLDQISQQIQNFNSNVSGGSITEMGTQYTVRGISALDNLVDFENLIIGYEPVVESTTDGRIIENAPIYLKNVATIEFKNKEPENIVKINGRKCIGVSIYKEAKYNTTKAVDEVFDALDYIQQALPGFEILVVSNQGSFIASAISEVEETGLLGVILAVFVLFLFLRRIGTTLIVSIVIPVSIIATFNLMYFNNLTINIMTLGGLALGAGMLVDNAIVVLENIFRNHESGMDVKEAAIMGTSQVGGAIFASTLTTVVVFLPIVYIDGASGELFKDEAWTVAFSLVSSLLVAIFLIPMLYNKFYKNKKAPVKTKSLKMTGYGNFLSKVLNFKWVIVVLATLLVAGSLFLVPVIGTEFMPQSETKDLTVNIKLQEGTQLSRTESTIDNIQSILQENLIDDIDIIYSHTGPSSGIGNDETTIFEGENTAEMRIILKEESPKTADDVIAYMNNIVGDVPGIEVTYSKQESALKSILGTSEDPIVVEVRGENLDVIKTITTQIQSKMEAIPGLSNIESSIADGAPEIEVVVDNYRTGIYNISLNSIVTQIETQLVGQNAGQVEFEGEMNDITLKLPEITLNELEGMEITSGEQIYRLDELASIRESVSPKEIIRSGQIRLGKITAQIPDNIPLDHMVNIIKTELNDVTIPTDYRMIFTGDEEMREESMSNLAFALILSLILVYMVLASQFESLIHPFTIILTIPLAVVGSILIFFILGKTLNIMAAIGIIILVGIAVNNSIILVDRINQLINEGNSRKEAIIIAGQQRIRPIIMTSLTTILALLPLTFGFGESATLRSPMALAVIGGLLTSTLLTLIVIPCMYDILDRVKTLFSAKPVESEMAK